MRRGKKSARRGAGGARRLRDRGPAWVAAHILVAAFLAGGCVVETREIGAGVDSFEIHVSSPGFLGDEAANLTVPTRDFTLDIMAIGSRGERPYEAFNGTTVLHVIYGGRQVPLMELPFSGGMAANVKVTVDRVFGKGVFWVEDAMDDNPSYAAGASAPIIFPNPSVSDIQYSDEETSPFSAALAGYQLRSGGQESIRRRVVVTAVTNSGFYATDLDGAQGGANSIFVFNYSRPEGLSQGDNLLWFSGTVAEHLGTTQITFPSWEACRESWCDGEVPPAVAISQETTFDKTVLEALESSLVQIGPIQIQDVDASGYDSDTYEQYGQYQVRLYDDSGNLGARFQVVSRDTVGDFDARDFAFDDFTFIRGVLSELNFKPGVTSWVLNVRDRCDICGPAYCPCGE